MRTMIILGMLLLGTLAYVKDHVEYHQLITSKPLVEVLYDKIDSQIGK